MDKELTAEDTENAETRGERELGMGNHEIHERKEGAEMMKEEGGRIPRPTSSVAMGWCSPDAHAHLALCHASLHLLRGNVSRRAA